TDTFRSNRLTLAEYGLQDRVHEINLAAARLAREVADEYEAQTGIERFVQAAWAHPASCPALTIRTSATSRLTSWPTSSRSRRAGWSRAAWTCCFSKPARTSSKSAQRSRGSGAILSRKACESPCRPR